MGKELFKNIPSKVGDLVKDVRNGRIGLPDLQRPFVWRDNKIRELFDSMLKGYPIGYIMLWESPVDYESKKSTIGDNSKTYEEPKELVIDGQQRLTALVAAMFAVKVKDKNFADREIKISYNPLTREFAVWSQAYEKDTEWISRISDVFLAKEDNSISSLRRHFIKEANEGRSKKGLPLLTDEEEDRIEDSINALLNLSDYSLPTLEISYNADEEDVADIFVRVNSGGQSLTENNCIATRMGNLVFFIIKPTNISVLPDSSISARIYALLNVVKGQAEIEMLALNSKESFELNKDFYRERLSQEELPAVRRLLEQDSKHLDRIQVLMASSREFYIIIRLRGEQESDVFSYLSRIEQNINDNGFTTRRTTEQDLKKMLGVYFEQNVTTEKFEDFDGDRWVIVGE